MRLKNTNLKSDDILLSNPILSEAGRGGGTECQWGWKNTDRTWHF